MLPTLTTLDAGLAKRLAEAADCFRDNLNHYFVCKLEFPYDLKYTTGYLYPEDASEAAEQFAADDYYKFGPYKTPFVLKEQEPTIDYDNIELHFMQNESLVRCQEFSNNVDAIILSLSAYDKFFQPYYVRLYGVDEAAILRQNAITALTASPKLPVLHKSGAFTEASTGGTRLVLGSSAEY